MLHSFEKKLLKEQGRILALCLNVKFTQTNITHQVSRFDPERTCLQGAMLRSNM